MSRLHAGAAKVDITPRDPVWMDGMIRAHRSEGVHDPLRARALVISGGKDLTKAVALVSLDICALSREDAGLARQEIEQRVGIHSTRIVIAASHTHSGPAAVGFFNPKESGYVATLRRSIVDAVQAASERLVPARVFFARGEEPGISHYRRLLSDDGKVVMNWEPFPAERILRVLGEADPEIGVVRIAADAPDSRTIAILFHHAGHPNTLSGENFLLTAEYPGLAARLLEERWGGEALYLNGALGSVDIDNFADRGWEGLDRLGRKLAAAVTRILETGAVMVEPMIASASCSYKLPARRISDADLSWARDVLRRTGGTWKPMPDGVGDDYKAKLYVELRGLQDAPVEIEQVCIALGDCAFVSFPGELYTEVGFELKKKSPFPHTHLMGLANGYAGYIPTARAISEGGYAEDTRRVDESAAGIVLDQSLQLLRAARYGR